MHTRAARLFVKSFFFSFLLHAAAVGLIVWIAWRIAVPAAHVFEVPPGEPASSGALVESGATSSSGGAPKAGSVMFKPLPIPVPRVAPAALAEPEAVEVAAQAARVPAPEPAVMAQRTPATSTTPTSATAVARPLEIPRPTTKATTLAQYRKEHPLPAASSSKPAAPVASAAPSASAPNAAARIDVGSVLAGGEKAGASEPSAAGVGTGERRGAGSAGAGGANGENDSFLARLSEKLREAHRKPEGMDDGLRASVAFVLHESGTISDVRIAKSSGDEAFDASAVAAFKRVTALGRPPASLIGANVIVFRTTAD